MFENRSRRQIGRFGRLFVAVVCFLALATHAVLGQTGSQAEIIGIVTDESGAVLPGVTVTATSPALQVGQLSAVTDAQGEYRLSGLSIGTYEVGYGLAGFQSVKREGVRLTAGFSARVDVQLKLGSLQETITVTGASPVVDATATNPVTTLTQETLELLPTSRNGVQAMLAQAPAVRSNLDVGGNTAGAIPVFRAFGQAGAWPVVEGVDVATPAMTSTAGIYLDYGAMEEVQVSVVGNDAEVPVRGIFLGMVAKSGSNRYRGSFASAYTSQNLISDNIDEELAAQGIRGVPILDRWDAGGDIGGKIVQDKLWFYGGARGRVNNNGVLDCVKPDGSVCETLLTQQFYSGKLSYQMNAQHQFSGYYQGNLKDNVTGATALVPWGSRFHQVFWGNLAKAEWQGTFGNRLVGNLLFGYWDFDSSQYGFDSPAGPEGFDDGPSAVDIVTQRRSGSSSTNYFTPDRFKWAKYQIKGSTSWFAPDSLMGDHNVKTGFTYIKGWAINDSYSHQNGDYILQYSNSSPFQIQVYNHPASNRADDNYYGFFVSDQWRVAQRLTLNLGARLAFDQLYIPAQTKEAGQFAQIYPEVSFARIDLPAWNTIVPRLHAAYDLTNDGRTVIKGGWGRFVTFRGTGDANYVNPGSRSSSTYRWRDLNGNRNYDPGEVNFTPNGGDFVSQTGFTRGILNPDEESPLTDEFTLSFERELFPNFAVRATGVYSSVTRNAQTINPLIPYEAYTIPVTNRDPGPDGLVNTTDDPGTTVTYWEFPSSLNGPDFQAATRVNDPRLDQSYRSFELAASKRLSNGWQAMASYSWTRLNEPPGTANPNQEIFAGNRTAEWSAKAAGSYQLPFQVLASLNYELRSGNPRQRTHLFRGGVTIPTIVLPVEPLGASAYDHLHLLDGRIRKEFRFATQKIAVGVDIFNLTNINTVTSVNTRSGPTFGQALTPGGNTATLPFIPGRNVQFTLNYSF
jgi:Carboxypeptidase regulatory-like domain